ncbi:Protein kinase-like domain containing protein [Naviculisporaceae sp. PSN 640]
MDYDYDSNYNGEDQDRPSNGLTLQGPPWGLEKIFDYEPGGHHPVHLGDILHQRYKVIHKLGSGGFANVWFCHDISPHASPDNKYVALKIIMDEGSNEECPELRVSELADLAPESTIATGLWCLPLDLFDIEGPNGKHFAFVYPVLGPRVSKLLPLAQDPNTDLGQALRKICQKTTQAMALLHAIGICHGDFRPANILVHISGLTNLSEDEVLRIIGVPKTNKVIRATEKDFDVESDEESPVQVEDHDLPQAPQYLVHPIDWDKALSTGPGLSLLGGQNPLPCVIDFGESYPVSKPTPDLGIPQVYCSPEYSLDGVVGVGSDIWALGCTLFEIRTGRKLFDMFDDDKDEYLAKTALVLGRFPEPWWGKWEAREVYFTDENEGGGKDVGGRVVLVNQGGSGKTGGEGETYTRPEPRSLEESIREGLFYESSNGPNGIEKPISEKEAMVFADLLGKLLRFNPEDRISPAEALGHEWFSFVES